MQMAITTTSASLLRLLQLSSVSLPVGGFSFSQGLEYAIECGWVSNLEETQDWLTVQLHESVARIDLPVLAGAMKAVAENDDAAWQKWNDIALANRETKELRLTDTAMGDALKRLLKTLSIPTPIPAYKEVSFVSLFAVAAQHWDMSFELAAQGFVWSWLENQVAAATKLVPLGQSQAQLLLGDMQNSIPAAITSSQDINEFTVGGSLPALAIASSLHETQYSRLFRS
jgi:urease accessory protein